MSVTFFGKHVLGEDDVVRFGQLRFWAERGLIHCEDGRTNGYESMSVRTFLHRARALSDMLGNSSTREMNTEDQFDQANRLRHLRFMERCAMIATKAQEQGMPSDPTASRDLVRRLPKTIVMNGGVM